MTVSSKLAAGAAGAAMLLMPFAANAQGLFGGIVNGPPDQGIFGGVVNGYGGYSGYGGSYCLSYGYGCAPQQMVGYSYPMNNYYAPTYAPTYAPSYNNYSYPSYSYSYPSYAYSYPSYNNYYTYPQYGSNYASPVVVVNSGYYGGGYYGW